LSSGTIGVPRLYPCRILKIWESGYPVEIPQPDIG